MFYKHHNYNLITLLRGVAIIIIVLVHIDLAVSSFYSYKYLFGLYNTDFGAVDLFFVLSGFMLMLSYRRYIGNPNMITTYLKRRFYRIIPAYWIVCSIVILIYVLWNPPLAQGLEYNPSFFIGNFLLLNGPRVISPSWFLNCEVFFCLLFLLIFLVKKEKTVLQILALYAVGILVFTFYPFSSFSPIRASSMPASIGASVLSLFVLEFIFGIYTAVLVIRKPKVLKAKPLFFSGILLWIGVCVAVIYFNKTMTSVSYLRFLYWGIPSSAIIAGAYLIEQKTVIRIPRVFKLIGQSSYSIYLLHMIILQSVFIKTQRVMRVYGTPISHFIGITLIAMITIGISMLFHVFVERRILTRFRR